MTTELCKIAYKYGSDKTPFLNHVYTPWYHHRWNDRRQEIKKVLEIGVATKKQMPGIPHYVTGASLYTWRDYFPNAQIYGVDIFPGAMIEGEDRITTFLQNSTDREGVQKIIDEIGSDIDIIIDYGSHYHTNQLATARAFKAAVDRGVDYVIEDVGHCRILNRELGRDFDVDMPYLENRQELQKIRQPEGHRLKNANKIVVVSDKPTQYEVSPKMKNLMIWISGTGGFHKEASYLVKIQIENALRLGWRREDILLVTNFEYEYMGVKATLTKGDHWIAERPRSLNTTAIPALIEEGILEDGYIYWNHDMDAYQLDTIHPDELELEDYDAGFTDYGWKKRWCMGSFFFKVGVKEFIEKVKPIVEKDIEDEDAVQIAMEENEGLAKRIKRMNITYNLGMRKVPENLKRVTKPIKVAHFHPHKHGLMGIFTPLMPYELVKIFEKYGFKE